MTGPDWAIPWIYSVGKLLLLFFPSYFFFLTGTRPGMGQDRVLSFPPLGSGGGRRAAKFVCCRWDGTG